MKSIRPVASLFLACLLHPFLSAAAEVDRPNILWVTTEDMSPFIGAYGDPVADTPNLDAFAQRAIRFDRAWSNMPICAPARSTLITGMYATSLGTMNLRSQVPQSAQVKSLPVLLREQGYHCTNNVKTDYNFSSEGMWDGLSSDAHWRDRPDPNTPFFHVHNIMLTHEGRTQALRHDEFEDHTQHLDPAEVPLPPYFPDHPKIREVMAHHYDLIGQMDRWFQQVLDELEADGLADDTIVFFFSDHGSGLPRYKRWLYETGLKVPLMVHVPERFAHLAPWEQGESTDVPVGFVDLPATVLALAGVPIPAVMQGEPVLGDPAQVSLRESPYLFGSRDRADDVEAVSRSVRNERFHYIRHYQPFRPYIRPALIYLPENKGMIGPLWELSQTDNPPAAVAAMFNPLPPEELYDLQADPAELNNLAADPRYAETKAKLADVLRDHLFSIRDTGFLPEGEMMRRSSHDSVFDMAQDARRFDFESVLAAAEIASASSLTVTELAALADSSDAAVRYWAALGLLNQPAGDPTALTERLMTDSNPMVASIAAEALLHQDPLRRDALDTLIAIASEYVESEPSVTLRAARSLVEIGHIAEPAIPEVHRLLDQISGPVWKYYRNWGYHMFIGMSLDQVLLNCGAPRDLSRN